MTLIHLDNPVLVQQRDGRFLLQTLLIPGFAVERRRYRDAEQAYRKELIAHYKERPLDRSEMDELLWYGLNDGLHFELMPLAFKSGLHHVEGLFALVRYRIKAQDYLCLPKLDHLTVQVPVTLTGRGPLTAFVEETVQDFLRRKRREREGDHVDHRPYRSQGGDTVVDIALDFQIKRSGYPFEHARDDLFSFMTLAEPLDGARELDRVGEDWNSRYPDRLQQALFREEEQRRLHQSLYGRQPTPTVLVASDGSGKSNLVQSLVLWHIEQDPRRSAHHRVKLWLVDPLRVISGMSVVGQWERRWEAILDHLFSRLRKTANIRYPDILYVDNPVALLRIGKSAQTNLTLAHLLRPYLEERRIPCLLEATPQQWQRVQELDRGFADLFQVIRLPALNAARQLKIIIGGRARLESEYRCRIDTSALTTLLKLEPQFRGDQALPGSALGALTQIAQRHRDDRVRQTAVYALYHTNFHFRQAIIDRDALLTGEEIDRFFQQRLIGQTAAHDALREVVLKIKSRLTPSGKPLCSLLLIGPTGVGKTESAKLLTDYLFERDECLVRIDLNEYGDERAVARLIGNNANPNGILTERVRYQRACVLLLDELEKAHPGVHDLLLQLLDDGRLTDALGRTTDFGQTVVIMTSNLGAEAVAKPLGFSRSETDRAATYRQVVERFFRPEFLNRIDKQVAFEPLRREHMSQLASLHLSRLIQRDGFVRRNTILSLETKTLDRLSEGGFDPQMGARALKRHLEQRITAVTAAVLAGHGGNEPIILRLYHQAGDLQSAIKTLRFAPKRESEVVGTYSMDQYRGILQRLREMDDALTVEDPDQPSSHLAWMLSGKIRDIIEPLQSFLWDAEERLRTRRLRVAFAVRPQAGGRIRNSWRGNRINFASLFAQADIRDYLNGLYQTGDACFTKDQLSEARLQTELRWLQMAYTGLLAPASDPDRQQGSIVMRSLLSGQGAAALGYLTDHFRRLIADVGAIEQEERIDDGHVLRFQGPGLRQLAACEQGIHLFIEERNRQLPIAVVATDGAAVTDQSSTPDTIIRLYALPLSIPRSSKDKHDDTVTDLRSGMQCGTELSLEDLKLLVGAALPAFPITEVPATMTEQ